MSSEEIMQIVNAVTPAAIAIIGVVTSCLKVISSFKTFKHTTAQDIDDQDDEQVDGEGNQNAMNKGGTEEYADDNE